MSNNIRIDDLSLYTTNTIEVDSLTNEYQNYEDLTVRFWAPNKLIINKLCNLLDNKNISTNIIDIGCGTEDVIFPKSTHLLDFNNQKIPNKTVFKLDLDFDTFSEHDHFYNFAYCRHTLEDIQNPQHAFAEITRIAKQGYIETPSPLVEITKNVDAPIGNQYHGYIHHRYFVWSDITTNTLYFLPKLPLVNYIHYKEDFQKKFNYILNNYSVYWNNYYIWDENNKPNIVVYRNDVNFNIRDDYQRILDNAIFSSIKYTNAFINTYLT